MEIDFCYIQPNKEYMLLNNWNTFLSKAIPYLKQNLKHKESVELIHSIDENTDKSKFNRIANKHMPTNQHL